MIKYHKGDLFELAPKGSILAHAVNCQGVWGSGIAKTFKEKFPEAFFEYKEFCENEPANPGDWLLDSDQSGFDILNLFTSKNFGSQVDDPIDILLSTFKCLTSINKSGFDSIWMPKINSGLFNVPWEWTEKVLNRFPDIIFNVCELEK